MTAAPIHERARTVDERLASRVVDFLERPEPGGERVEAVLRHQSLLEALDRAEYRRLVVWPEVDPAAVAHLSAAGTLVLAGAADAAPYLAGHLQGAGWRVLLGDAALADRFLSWGHKGLRKRKAHAREQRFMSTTAPERLLEPDGWRLATLSDLDAVAELACRLHVEDRMGPPLSRSSRAGVAERMRSSIAREATWVVERDGAVVAKFDVSLWSRRRGAQIAGVYVAEAYRGQGIAGQGVGAVSRVLLAEGLPGVTLHVRADNLAGRRAYERAGFIDRGAWTLALR